MKRDTTSDAFVDRLEAHLLDNQGDLHAIRDELTANIEEARFLGDDERTDILDSLATLLDHGEPDDADVLPLIFGLRERYEITQDATGAVDGAVSSVAFDIPDNDRDLFSLPAETEVLVRESERLGRQAYVITVEIEPRYVDIVHETIESAFPVVHSVTGPGGRLAVLVVTDQEPRPTSRIVDALPEDKTAFDVKVRPVSYDLLNGTASVAQSWYARVPAVHMTPQYETIERLLVLVQEIERNHDDFAGAVWDEFRHTIATTFLLDLKEVFEEMRPTVVELARDVQKRIIVRIGGDTDTVTAPYADLLRENVFELVCNAIQHGIETPDERRAAGKPEAGTVHILVRETVGRLVIRVHDDGRGVNQDELKVAFSRHSNGGLGRVRSTVASRFGGKLTLKTGDRGTTAELDVPYGVGAYRAVIFHRHGAYFAAPATFVVGTPELTEQSVVADSAGAPYIRVSGRVLPFLEGETGESVPVGSVTPQYGIVLQVGSGECVVAADRLDGEVHALPVSQTPGWVTADEFDEPIAALMMDRLF